MGGLFRRLFGGSSEPEQIQVSIPTKAPEPVAEPVTVVEVVQEARPEPTPEPEVEKLDTKEKEVPSFRPGQRAPIAGTYAVYREGEEIGVVRELAEGGRFPPPPRKGDVYRLTEAG